MPIDGTATQTIQRYEDATRASGPEYDHDPGKQKYFVFIHGYNVTSGGALDSNNELFRRLFWLGFRGHYIGVTWQGDDWRVNVPGRDPWALFDPNVKNALQTSPSVRRFLMDLRNQPGTSAGDIDVMCHSLGNLVGMDALRIHREESGDGGYV